MTFPVYKSYDNNDNNLNYTDDDKGESCLLELLVVFLSLSLSLSFLHFLGPFHITTNHRSSSEDSGGVQLILGLRFTYLFRCEFGVYLNKKHNS